ncbi:hypothetical protein KAS08_01190 [Candidatus Pacearchaeota archaeon]|nr:hypothetical protein [Candidatus Pacearchaeota archaeon]
MTEQIEDFTIKFFQNLKCKLSKVGEFLIVENVPKSFEDLLGTSPPYKINFTTPGVNHFVGKGSLMFTTMTKYLSGTGKTTLLKIDFDVDPVKEIKSAISLENCEIDNLEKRHRNNFFSRFTFVTTFRYMNESEQIINEIYIHNGKIVNGDLSGYTVTEGESDKASSNHIKKDYKTAKEILKEILNKKTAEIGENLEKKAEEEIARINIHYDKLIRELGTDLATQLEKVKKTELSLRTAPQEEIENLRTKLDRLKKSLIKIGDDDARVRVLKEKEFTIKDAIHKHSLSVDNKLANTTIIYYPVFSFNLFLKGDSSGRFIEMNYDPLTKTLNKLNCESCGKEISKINLCSAGHISCDDCLSTCNDCGKTFCKNCLKRSCSICGKSLCKSCFIVCHGCGKSICKEHLRKDCVTGDERCRNCLRACLRCHGMTQEKYFGIAIDGSKVCQKCLGEEKRKDAMDRIFRN